MLMQLENDSCLAGECPFGKINFLNWRNEQVIIIDLYVQQIDESISLILIWLTLLS